MNISFIFIFGFVLFNVFEQRSTKYLLVEVEGNASIEIDNPEIQKATEGENCKTHPTHTNLQDCDEGLFCQHSPHYPYPPFPGTCIMKGVEGRGLPGCAKKKGKCENEPREFTISRNQGFSVEKALACVAKGGTANWKQKGNYVEYSYYERDQQLELSQVCTEYCKPKPENCHCNTLFARVLQENMDVNKITGTFAATPWQAGCKCYLGAAARAGFKYVKLASRKEICQNKREFNTENYGTICALYGEQKCDDNQPTGEITKT